MHPLAERFIKMKRKPASMAKMSKKEAEKFWNRLEELQRNPEFRKEVEQFLKATTF